MVEVAFPQGNMGTVSGVALQEGAREGCTLLVDASAGGAGGEGDVHAD